MWRISDFFWRLKVILGILLNPKKLWFLPEMIQNFASLEVHERDLHEDGARDDEDRCIKHGYSHKILADEYAEMLGPFVRDTSKDVKWTQEEIDAFNAEWKLEQTGK